MTTHTNEDMEVLKDYPDYELKDEDAEEGWIFNIAVLMTYLHISVYKLHFFLRKVITFDGMEDFEDGTESFMEMTYKKISDMEVSVDTRRFLLMRITNITSLNVKVARFVLFNFIKLLGDNKSSLYFVECFAALVQVIDYHAYGADLECFTMRPYSRLTANLLLRQSAGPTIPISLAEAWVMSTAALESYDAVANHFLQAYVRVSLEVADRMKLSGDDNEVQTFAQSSITLFITEQGYEYLSLVWMTNIGNIDDDTANFLICKFKFVVGPYPSVKKLFQLLALFNSIVSYLCNRGKDEAYNLSSYEEAVAVFTMDDSYDKFIVNKGDVFLNLSMVADRDYEPDCCYVLNTCKHGLNTYDFLKALGEVDQDSLVE